MIKSILKFCEIPRNMFLRESMISSGKRILYISKNGVDPFESGMFSCLSSTTYDMSFMDAFCLNHGIETLKPIRDNRTSWINIFQAPLFNFFVLKTFNFVKFYSMRMLVSISFYLRWSMTFPSADICILLRVKPKPFFLGTLLHMSLLHGPSIKVILTF